MYETSNLVNLIMNTTTTPLGLDDQRAGAKTTTTAAAAAAAADLGVVSDNNKYAQFAEPRSPHNSTMDLAPRCKAMTTTAAADLGVVSDNNKYAQFAEPKSPHNSTMDLAPRCKAMTTAAAAATTANIDACHQHRDRACGCGGCCCCCRDYGTWSKRRTLDSVAGDNAKGDKKNVDGEDGAEVEDELEAEENRDMAGEDGDGDEDTTEEGHKHRTQDLLLLPLQVARYESIISRTCYYAWYVLTRQSHSDYCDVQDKVLNSDRVRKAVESAASAEHQASMTTMATKESEATGTADDIEGKRLHLHQGYTKLMIVTTKEYQAIVAKHRRRAYEQLMRLRSCISSSLMKIAGWILYRLLARIFTSIQFNKAQIDRVRYCMKQSGERKIPIVYLPLHRSHLDYILISFILYMNNIKPPLVAAGDNLQIPFFGNLLRGLGAFFIRRPGKAQQQHKDAVYQAVLHSYITQNLSVGNSLEFFIEGGRTRSGKMMLPKLGLLKIVVDAVMEGAIDDVYIVPVSIAYERLVDGSFVNERLGQKKAFENFGLASRAIWKALHSNYGNVRVDFSKPFLLKEYLSQAHSHDLVHPADVSCVACKETVPMNKLGFPKIVPRAEFNLKLNTNETQRKCIESLASHVIQDAYKESALMSTHLVSFLLLTKYRKGVTIEQLAKDVEGLRDLLSREKGVHFSSFGDLRYFVKQALTFLGRDRVKTQRVCMNWSSNGSARANSMAPRAMATPRYRLGNDNTWQLVESNEPDPMMLMNGGSGGGGTDKANFEVFYAKPVLRLASALHLHYYANSCISLFHLESIFATVLFRYTNGDLNHLICDPNTYLTNLTIEKGEFLARCKQLCNILQYEFYFYKTCKTLDQALEEMFNVFVSKNIFVTEGQVLPPPSSLLLANLVLPRPGGAGGDVGGGGNVGGGAIDGSHYYTKLINRRSHANVRKRRSKSHKVNGLKSAVITLPTLQEESGECEPDSAHDSSMSEDEEECNKVGKDNLMRCSTSNVNNNNNNDDDDSEYHHQQQPNNSAIDLVHQSNDNRAEFSLLLTEKNCQLLNFYCSVLGPYVESYWLVADKLAQFISATTTNTNTGLVRVKEKSFLQDLTNYGEQMIDKETIIYEESISYDKFQNALKYFQSIEAIRRVEEATKKMPANSFFPTTILTMSASKTKKTSTAAVSSSPPAPTEVVIEYDRNRVGQLAESLGRYRHAHGHRHHIH